MKAVYRIENGAVKESFSLLVGEKEPKRRQLPIGNDQPELLSVVERDGLKWIVTQIDPPMMTCRQIVHS